MYRQSQSRSKDHHHHHFTRSPSPNYRYNPILDDDTMSIELGRTVPQYSGRGRDRNGGYKETETLSERDYFKMDDLFKKDRDEFLKKKNDEAVVGDDDDDVTQRFRSSTFKIIDELPSNVASKYGDVLADLTNKFIQEHLALKARYNELLKSKNIDDPHHGRRDKEQTFLIEKLTGKLKNYKAMNAEYQNELEVKDDVISNLQFELQNLKAVNDGEEITRPKSQHQQQQQKATVHRIGTTKIAEEEEEEEEDKEKDLSMLINELKTGMSKIELEEELRIKRELQQKEYKLLKQQLEDLQNERKRKNSQVLNRDLDQFKMDLKTEMGELFKSFQPAVAAAAANLNKSNDENVTTSPVQVDQHTKTHKVNDDDVLFDKLKVLIQNELKLNNEQLRERFDTLLQNKVNRDELEALLLKSNATKEEQFKKTMSIFELDNKIRDCKFCSRSDLKKGKESLNNEIEILQERLRLLSNEISRLENNEELDETEAMRLISERHSVRQQLKEKNYELENFVFNDQDVDATSSEQPQESDNCHTINILRDNAQKFGISLRKN